MDKGNVLKYKIVKILKKKQKSKACVLKSEDMISCLH